MLWGEQMMGLVIVFIAIILVLVVKIARKNVNNRRPSNDSHGSEIAISIEPHSFNSIDNNAASDIGKKGEDEVSCVLNSLPQGYFVVNNAIIPDQVVDPSKKYTTQIDHVVVSPYGIFVIETKNYKGLILGTEKSKEWKEVFRTTPEHYFYNPIKQNWGHIFALAEHLRLNTRLFKPVVVFSDKCELNVKTTTPVVYLSDLKEHILSYSQELIPRKNVEKINDRLCKIILDGAELEDKHIQSIGERLSEKEDALREGKCPRCGGKLKLRNGKYGAFYGCSNYPRCRFTQDAKR